MTGAASAISGSLFPGHYLVERLAADAAPPSSGDLERLSRRLDAWWSLVTSRCGPATGIRAVLDVVAMPLFALLDFRAMNVTINRQSAEVHLRTPAGRSVGLIVLPWASHPSGGWREAVVYTRRI